MESTDKTIPDADFEFSQEELEEALKKKMGRPSNRTRQLRERIKDANRLSDILGIIDSGVLERLAREPTEGDSPSDTERDIPVDKQEIPEGFTADLLKRSGLVNDKFIETNKHVLALSDGVVHTSLVTYGPPIIGVIGALAGLWVAEGKIEDFPPVLHTGMELLTQLLRLTTVLSTFVADGLGGITDFITDPIGTVQEEIEKVFATTPEEKQAAVQRANKKVKQRRKDGLGIESRRGLTRG